MILVIYIKDYFIRIFNKITLLKNNNLINNKKKIIHIKL